MKTILHGSTIEYRDRITNEIECEEPYFHPDYINIMSGAELSGAPEFFLLREGKDFVYYQYVKRDIADEIELIPKDNFFDITTPFDYGGYYYSNPKLLNEFFQLFHQYCVDAGIISEFLRLLPTHAFHYAEIGKSIHLKLLREQIFIDLLNQDFRREFNGSKRDNLRKARKYGLTIILSQDIQTFLRLYRTTMLHRKADQYFFFKEDILIDLFNNGSLDTWYAMKDSFPVSGCVILKGKLDVYYFLAASDRNNLSLGASTLLIAEMADHYRREKRARLFLGGGQNGVQQFKEGFSKKKVPYYIGCKEHIKKKCDYLIDLTGKSHNDYFPKYRKKII